MHVRFSSPRINNRPPTATGEAITTNLVAKPGQALATQSAFLTIPSGYVAMTIPTSEEEILNEEPQAGLTEGFSIPDPAKPEQFQLAPGLCTLVQYASNPPVKLGAKGIEQNEVVQPPRVLLGIGDAHVVWHDVNQDA